jgi:microcystin-dependent protein
MPQFTAGQLVTDLQMNRVSPIGVIAPYGGTAAPDGWLLCDGTAYNRTTYSELFTAIGTAYGAGDGSTTFNVPDGRGRVLVGVNATGPALINTRGNNDGRALSVRNVSHFHYENTTGGGGIVQFGFGYAAPLTGVTSGDANNQDYPAFITCNYIIRSNT